MEAGRELRAVAALAHREGAAVLAGDRVDGRPLLVAERVPVAAAVAVGHVLVVAVLAVVDQAFGGALLEAGAADRRARCWTGPRAPTGRPGPRRARTRGRGGRRAGADGGRRAGRRRWRRPGGGFMHPRRRAVPGPDNPVNDRSSSCRRPRSRTR